MKLLDAINLLILHGGEGLPPLDEFLRGLAEKYPDAAPSINDLLAKADAAVPPEGESLVGELKNFAATRSLNPRNPPSNLA